MAAPSPTAPAAPLRRALITGLSGFTGRHLAAELRAHGWEVWGLGQAATVEGEPHYVQADLLDLPQLEVAVAAAAPTAVFHLAAIAFVGHGSAADFYRVNVGGTRNLLQALAALSAPPDCVVLASSANVYGQAAAGQISETAPWQPANDYAVSKVAMEMMARLWQERLPLVTVRPFNYSGRGQAAEFLVAKIVDHYRRRAPAIELGNLEVWRDFSDVRDVVRAYRLLAERCPAGETVNICSGRSLSLLEILASAEQLSAHQLEVKVNPAFVRANEIRTLYGDPGHLTALLGSWQPRPFEETLAWMLAD